MTKTETNDGFGYPLGRSWSARGRTAAPKLSHRPFSYLGWLLTGGVIILAGIKFLYPNDIVYGLPIVIFLGAIGASIDEYRKVAWQIQRLHDMGETGAQAVRKRWPVWILYASLLALSTYFFTSFYQADHNDGSNEGLMIMLLLSLLCLPVSIFVASHIYVRRILRPFNEHLFTTPGNPGPNKYGPPPAI
jgi:uncharacterized membrane protein YhaH (DUF805 family)